MQVILFTDVSSQPGYGKYGGTYKIATEIRDAGYTCQVIDNFSWLGLNRLKLLMDKFITDETIVVGVSCTLNEKYVNNGQCQHWGIPDLEFIDLIKYIKAKNSNIKIVVGGARINVLSNWNYVDYAVVNKGDIAVVKVLEHLTTGSELKYSQNENTKIVMGDDYFYTQEQFAKSQIKFEHNDIILPKEALPIETARGCIFSCAFCQFDLIGKRKGDWNKDADALYAEFMRNYEMFGTTDYQFADEIVNETVEKLEMICSVVERLPFKLQYTAFARLDLIHKYPEMRELILRSGAVNLSFGIETFDDAAGKRVGKGLSSDKIKNVLKYCNELWKDKLIVSATFIIGLPGETEESIRASFDYVSQPDSGIDMYHFFPLNITAQPIKGTVISKIENDPDKYGYTFKDHPYDWVSNTMSHNHAWKISHDLQFKHPSRKIRTPLSWISRYHILGYTVEELFNIIRTSDHTKEIEEKINAIKEEYFKRLMSL